VAKIKVTSITNINSAVITQQMADDFIVKILRISFQMYKKAISPSITWFLLCKEIGTFSKAKPNNARPHLTLKLRTNDL